MCGIVSSSLTWFVSIVSMFVSMFVSDDWFVDLIFLIVLCPDGLVFG